MLKTLCTYIPQDVRTGQTAFGNKRLQLNRVEGIILCGFAGTPLADPVHGEDRDTGIVLSCVPVDSKKDALQSGLCEVFFESVRIDERVFPAAYLMSRSKVTWLPSRSNKSRFLCFKDEEHKMNINLCTIERRQTIIFMDNEHMEFAFKMIDEIRYL